MGVELKILLKGLGCTFGRDNLTVLSDGFLGDQVHALPVVCCGSRRIGGNHLVEGHDCIIPLARIGENSTFVEQVRGGVRRVQSGRLGIVGHGIIDLVGLRISVCGVVMVGGYLRVVVGIFLCCIGGGPQVNCLLIVDRGRLVALFFLFGIGLLGRRHAVGVAEFEPDQVASAVDLIGLIQGGDCGLEVAGIRSRLGGIESFVERADGFRFARGVGGSFRLCFVVFRGRSLGLGCVHLFFLQVEVLHHFVQAHRDVSEVKKFLPVFAELDVVLAGDDAKREVLALVVGFELISMAGFGPSPLYFGLCDGFSLGVFASSLHRARGLR